eukprot:4485921-Amphidinium_carterae.1
MRAVEAWQHGLCIALVSERADATCTDQEWEHSTNGKIPQQEPMNMTHSDSDHGGNVMKQTPVDGVLCVVNTASLEVRKSVKCTAQLAERARTKRNI